MTLQRHAEEAIATRLVAARQDRTISKAALVAIDPRTGEVLALVGGRDFHTSSFNRAMQAKRQPGSAFKPLLFAAAIEQGYTPSSQVTGMDTPIHTAQGDWLPSGEHEAASYTLRQALTVSSNRAAARVMQLVGITTTQTYARRLGISSPLPAVPSLALGTGEVTLLDLTSAYGAFANSGIIAPHTLITRIEDRNGNLIWQSSLDRHPYRAVRPGTAYLMSSMMADVMNRGTGLARAHGRIQAAGCGQNRNDRRLRRRVVRGLHAESRRRRLVRLRREEEDHEPRICRNGRGPGVGALHEEGDRRQQPGLVRHAVGRRAHRGVPQERHARVR